MLVLTRNVSEKIMIGDDIVITIVTIDRGRVRIGIDAPRDMIITREELLPTRKVEKDESDGK